MSNDPDQIRAEIEATRRSLSTDVNTLTDQVRPSSVARRKVDKARGTLTTVREKVMGTASDLSSSGGSKVSDAGSKIGDVASSSQDVIASAPSAVRSQTQGNPLAAGLIAFGLGMVVASLIPAGEQEQRAATKLKENASVVTDPISEVAKDVGGNLQGPAQDAFAAVKTTASDAADTLTSESTSAVQDVKDQTLEAKDAVQATRNHPQLAAPRTGADRV